jgi:hypothetical protein
MTTSPLPRSTREGEDLTPTLITGGADLCVCPKQYDTQLGVHAGTPLQNNHPAGADLQSVPFDTPVTNRRERNVAGIHPSFLLLFPSPCGEGQGRGAIFKFSNP